MWGLLQFVVANAGLLLIANSLAGWVYSKAHLSRKLVATLALYQVLVTIVTLGLGLVGWLHAFWIPTLALALLSLPFVKRAFPNADHGIPSPPAVHRDWMASPPFLCVLLALLVVWAVQHGMLGGTMFLDDRSHHAARIAQWYQDGDIGFHFLNYQSYYPANAELFTLWFTLPFGNDALTPLVGIVYALILVALCFDCGFLLRLPIAASAMAAGLILTSKKLSLHALSFSDNELGIAAMSCAAIVLALPTQRDYMGHYYATPHACALVALIGGVAGSAFGMGGFAVPLALLALFVTLWHISQTSFVRPLTTTAVFLSASAITGGYWYLRNLVLTGNPIFPLGIGPLPGSLTAGDPDSASLISAIGQAESGRLVTFARQIANWSYLHLVGVLAGYVAAITMLLRRRHCDRHHRDVIAAIMSIGLINLLLYPLLPFVGYDQRLPLESSGRPLFLWYVSGAILFAIAIAPLVRGFGPTLKRLSIALLWFLVVVISLANIRATLAYLFVPAAFIIMVAWILIRRSDPENVRHTVLHWLSRWGHQIKIYTCVIVFIECAAFYPLSLKRQSESALKNWTALQVKRLPTGSTVSIYDGQNDRFPAHDLFGRDWQYNVVRLLDNGRLAPPLHRRRRPVAMSFWDFEHGREHRLPDAATFTENLRKAGVNYLFTTKVPFSSDPGTPQARLLQDSGLLGIFEQSTHGTVWIVAPREEAPTGAPGQSEGKVLARRQ